MARTKFYEVWADVIISCQYEVEAKTAEEAVSIVQSDDLIEKRRVRATNPMVTSVECLEGDKNVSK